MFSNRPNYLKLRTNLKLCINRLKLLEKKKTELALKSRREIADYIGSGKHDRARIRVEHIIREDYLVETMEILEMLCDLILARFGLIEKQAEIDPGLEEAIATLIWITPRLSSDIQEFKEVTQQFIIKYGKEFAEMCRKNQLSNVNEKVVHKMDTSAPPKILVENYMVEIARSYKVAFEPDPLVMLGSPPELLDFANITPGDLDILPTPPLNPTTLNQNDLKNLEADESNPAYPLPKANDASNAPSKPNRAFQYPNQNNQFINPGSNQPPYPTTNQFPYPLGNNNFNPQQNMNQIGFIPLPNQSSMGGINNNLINFNHNDPNNGRMNFNLNDPKKIFDPSIDGNLQMNKDPFNLDNMMTFNAGNNQQLNSGTQQFNAGNPNNPVYNEFDPFFMKRASGDDSLYNSRENDYDSIRSIRYKSGPDNGTAEDKFNGIFQHSGGGNANHPMINVAAGHQIDNAPALPSRPPNASVGGVDDFRHKLNQQMTWDNNDDCLSSLPPYDEVMKNPNQPVRPSLDDGTVKLPNALPRTIYPKPTLTGRNDANLAFNLPDLPDLPNVPSNSSIRVVPGSKSEDVDFDDLSRRFEELKKKK